MKILVADDDAVSRELCKNTLARYGHTVEVVPDGTAAWTRVEGNDRPDLAVLALQMPGLDGLEICRRLRTRSTTRHTHVILATPGGSPRHGVEGLEAGADDFIAKPIAAEELGARVRAAERWIGLHLEMERSRAYLEAVLANIDIGVILMDPSGRVVYGNPALARMSGMRLEEVLTLTRDDFVRMHSEHLADGETLVERLGVGSMLPLDAEVDIEGKRPKRLTYRWSAKHGALPAGLGELELLRDVTEEVQHEREQLKLARIDHLTGLRNRLAAEEIGLREVSRSRRAQLPLSVVLADIDLFKRVNDTFGHNVGDEVLREVSRALVACCRVTDVAVRWGGEELVVLLPNTSLAGAKLLAERIRLAVQEMDHAHLPHVTISCGVAELSSEDTALESALARADERLYEAKASGRNTVR